MHVWCTERNVAQRGHFERTAIGGIAGHIGAAVVCAVHAQALKAAVGEERARVTVVAAGGTAAKEREPAFLGRAEGGAVTAGIAIKGRVVGKQRALKCCQCKCDLFELD